MLPPAMRSYAGTSTRENRPRATVSVGLSDAGCQLSEINSLVD